MPYKSWCFSHRKSDGYTGPLRVACDFMFLSSRVHLASPGLTIFSIIDKESQPMAAALSVKAASDLLGKILPGYVGTHGGVIRCPGVVTF